MEPVLAKSEWLAGTFSVVDILMANVLRFVDRFDGLAGHPACHDYVARATAPPVLREGTCRPDGAFRCGRLSNTTSNADGRLTILSGPALPIG
jgi:hypothetical protein